MKAFSYLFFFFIYISFLGNVCAQSSTKSYEQYQFGWDSVLRLNFVVDTITGQKSHVKFGGCAKHRVRFVNGFVEARIGDQKALMQLNGNKLLGPSHFINYDLRDSIISAYVCNERAWIFLNFKGDTLSMGRMSPMNYIPNLTMELNVESCVNKEGTEKLWGYLNKKAEWQIAPQYQFAEPFNGLYAKVKVKNKWGAINPLGELVVAPIYTDQNFELPKTIMIKTPEQP